MLSPRQRFWVLIFLLNVGMLAPPAVAQQLVRVGVFDNPPIVFRSEHNRMAGIAIDVIEDVARRNDWQLQYRYAPWNELLGALDAGQIDVLVGIAYTPQRAERYRFTAQTLVNNWGVVYQSANLSLSDISELQGRRVALMDRSTHSQRFDELMQGFGFDYTPVRVPHYSDVMVALQESRADAGVVNRIFSILNEGRFNVKPTSILFNPVQVRFAAPGQGESLYLPVIDAYLNEAKADRNSYYYDRLKHWLEKSRDDMAVPGWLWIVLGVIVAGMLLGGLYVYLVRSQVQLRTRELQEAESRFGQLAEAVNAVFWMSSTDWRTFFYVSPGYKKIWGDDPAILLQHPGAWLERVHEEDYACLEPLIENKRHQVLSEYTFPDFRIRDQAGRLRWISSRIYPVRDDAGQVIRIAGIAQDVTEQHQTYLKLQESEQRYRTSIDHAPEAITILDVDTGKFVDVNKNGEKLFGLAREKLLQLGPADLSPPAQPDGQSSETLARDYIARAVAGETPTFDWIHRDSLGNPIDCEIRLVRLPAEQHNLVRGSITDVSERKIMQSRLQESRERLQTVVDRASVVLFALDANGIFTLSEGQALAELGLKPGEVVGESAFTLYRDNPAIIDDLHRALRGEVFRVESQVGDFYFETHYSPVYDAQGLLNGCIGVAVNITEQVDARRQLENQQQKLELAMEVGQVGIWDWDMTCDLVEWSTNLEQMYGLEKGTFRGRFEDFVRQVYPEDMDKITAAVNEAIAQGRPFKIDNRIIRTNGEVRWVYSQARLKYDEQGSVVGMLGLTSDLTEIKKAEQELRLREEQLAEAQRIAHLGSWDLDMTSLKAAWSDEEYRLLGYEVNGVEATLDNFIAAVHVDDRELVEEAIQRALGSQEGVFDVEHRVRHPDGEIRYLHEQGWVNFNKLGQPQNAIGTSLDVTEQKLAQQELLKHKYHLEELVEERTAELQRINKELESFSYSVSHDLRAPLRAIDGFSQALHEDYHQILDEHATDYLDRIRHAAANMANLIDSLLKLSRLSRSKFKRERVDLSRLAQEVAEEQKQQLVGDKREIVITVHAGMETFGDVHMLRIMLSNLVDNAIKYSRHKTKAEIEIGVRSGNSSRTVFFVSDNGAGFDMRYADKLFGAFQRLHGDDEFEGLGIGLATVQRIVHRHGGRIWAEAVPDQGAVFYFVL